MGWWVGVLFVVFVVVVVCGFVGLRKRVYVSIYPSSHIHTHTHTTPPSHAHTQRPSKYAPHVGGPLGLRLVLLDQGFEHVDLLPAAQPEDVGLGEEALISIF